MLAVATTSCFTGIESTPVVRSDASSTEQTEEQAFGQRICAEPPAGWLSGKQWYVVDDKIGMIFFPVALSDSLAGTLITLTEVRKVPTATGEDAIELTFDTEAGRRVYRPGVSVADFAQRSALEIPFAVEMSCVQTANDLMKSQTYFITTPRWYDEDGRLIFGLRHIPVTILAVMPGNAAHPLRVAFQAPRFDDATHYVMMSYGTSAAATRNFHTLFSFSDPRLRYPHIEDAIWEKITHSQVAYGMTRDECRLALGVPRSIERGATQAAQIERWTYDDGYHLTFEDGILTHIF